MRTQTAKPQSSIEPPFRRSEEGLVERDDLGNEHALAVIDDQISMLGKALIVSELCIHPG